LGKYIFSSPADADLLGIYEYTLETWGIKQYQVYKNLIFDAINWLSENPFTIESKKRFDLHPGCYFYHVGKHFIVYRFINGRLEVARVLHENMDFEKQLKAINFKFDK